MRGNEYRAAPRVWLGLAWRCASRRGCGHYILDYEHIARKQACVSINARVSVVSQAMQGV